MSLARAELLELASHWAESAPRALRAQLPGAWQVRVIEIELVESALAMEELEGGWVAEARRGGHGPLSPVLALAIHGGIIEATAARRCGDARGREGSGPVRRPPTAAAVRLFDPTGHAVLESWLAAWNRRGQGELVASPALPGALSASRARGATPEPRLGELGGRGELLRVTLAWSGSVQGRCQVVVAPAALVPLIEEAGPADPQAALERLAEVQVELSVELGTLQLALDQLRRLQPGACFTLPTFVDAPVPIFVGGVLKAWGTPVVHRGVLAVAVEQVVGGRGGAR
jgi:flagellar motor switch/type III secretory pathway protein FliN